MPDLAAEIRHAIEATALQQLEAMAAQRGWDEGARSWVSQGSPSGGESGDPPAPFEFATGYDSGSGLTTMAFTFDISQLNGPDLLL
jgi:hypothetical protein